LNDSQNREKDGRHNNGTEKVVVALLVLTACAVVWFLSNKSWIVWLLLLLPAFACAEYLGDRWLSQNWFKRFSVEHSGFSILRIFLGVVIVLFFVGVVVVGRLIFLRVF